MKKNNKEICYEVYNHITKGERRKLTDLERHCWDMAAKNEYVKTTHDFIMYFYALLSAHEWGNVLDEKKRAAEAKLTALRRLSERGCRNREQAIIVAQKIQKIRKEKLKIGY
jgi:hypothetical protein